MAAAVSIDCFSGELMSRVLVIEDDRQIAVSLVKGLEQHGFDARSAYDGARGLELVMQWEPDLVVVDLMLPEVDGFEILERCRDRTSVPFIVLTARTELGARLKAFEQGAIDFLSKPFWLEELIARIRIRLGLGARETESEVFAWADVCFDLDAARVTRSDEDLGLTSHEINVLRYLVRRPGRALSRDQIARGALSIDGETSARTVDSHVARLRKKLGDEAAASIATVWGVGYRFEGEPS